MIWHFYLQVFSISLFWVGAVFCNTLHVIVSGMVFLVLFHGDGESSSLPSKSLVWASRYAVTTSFGSICYGSLFTAAIRTLRWEVGTHGSSLFRLSLHVDKLYVTFLDQGNSIEDRQERVSTLLC